MTLTQYFVAMSIDGYIAEPAEQLDWLSQFSDLKGKRRRYERFFDQVGAIAMGGVVVRVHLSPSRPLVLRRPTHLGLHPSQTATPRRR
ncbi:hypothetical protein [Micromonospora echinaurantiaca]|uniref:hypothetical protein n=1 Tax=Micromonospora echinaurantiaca TaxID=47857 RepID=UPI0034305E5C